MTLPPPKQPIHGWVNLDKPKGLTSTQALGKVRKILGGKKAGHGGTLDPLASGVLPLAFGEATKLIPYIMDGKKIYRFTIGWGEARSTDDEEGEIVATSPSRPTEAAIRAALPRFTGVIMQKPPAFSAIKIDGERAYDIARRGDMPVMEERETRIDSFELIAILNENLAEFRVFCGKGTYIRSLARDLGEHLGTRGHVKSLIREGVGPFRLESSISLEKLEEIAHNSAASADGFAGALLPLTSALDDIPALEITASEAHKLRQGQAILIRPQAVDLMDKGTVMALHAGQPVAMIEARSGAFHVVRGFHF
jgi:tRNA pseudouridine55 synthase